MGIIRSHPMSHCLSCSPQKQGLAKEMSSYPVFGLSSLGAKHWSKAMQRLNSAAAKRWILKCVRHTRNFLISASVFFLTIFFHNGSICILLHIFIDHSDVKYTGQYQRLENFTALFISSCCQLKAVQHLQTFRDRAVCTDKKEEFSSTHI